MDDEITITLDKEQFKNLIDCVEVAYERYGYHEWYNGLLGTLETKADEVELWPEPTGDARWVLERG